MNSAYMHPAVSIIPRLGYGEVGRRVARAPWWQHEVAWWHDPAVRQESYSGAGSHEHASACHSKDGANRQLQLPGARRQKP